VKSFLIFSLCVSLTGRALAEEAFDWPDRRPIGTIFLATSGMNWPKNPRGYFNDPEMDISTEAGRARLRERMMQLADDSIAQVKNVGAQGVIVWDIEGGEMPHAVTYLGDPRVLPQVAPEMDAIADEFFAKFREAGVATGICIRPSSIVFKDPADPAKYPWIKGRYGHTDGATPVQNLADKITYAKKRWGCTNFYMDTNYTPRMVNGEMQRKANGSPDFRMLSSAEMAELRAAHPDVLIWPEFQEPDYFASCTGYGEYHQVGQFTEAAREKYPKAFRVWMPRLIPDDIYAAWEDFISNGVMKGEVFLFECAPAMSPMGDVLKNAGSEAALRSEKQSFQPATDTEGLIAQLRSAKDWARRRVLVEALASDPGPAATAALAGILAEEVNGLQWFAANSLGKQGTEASLQVLKQGVASQKKDEKLAAIKGLGASGKSDMAGMLLPLLDSKDDPAVRWAAIDALGQLGNHQAAPPLLDYMKSLEGTTAIRSREKVVRVLGLLGDTSAVPALQAALANPEYARLRKPILDSLTRLGATGKTEQK